MKKIFNESHVFAGFHDWNEKDFFIQGFGYDNFNFIKPLKPFRIQKFYTIHFVLSGKGILNTNGKQYRVKKEDIFFLPPDSPISYYPDPDDPWQYIWFELNGENTEKYASVLGIDKDNPIIKSCDFMSAYYSLYSVISKLEKNLTVGYYEVLAAFYKFLDINTQRADNNSENFSETVISYLLCHYQNPRLSIEDISRDFRISHSYLCKIFKRDTGKPIVRHLTEIRLREACRLLKTTSLGIKEIAYSAGFSDEIYFMKVFKKNIGTTPKKYRNEN